MVRGVTHGACGGFPGVSCAASGVLPSSEEGQVGVGIGLLQSLSVIAESHSG